MVFGSIVNECYVNKDGRDPELHCIFNENESACSYGIAIGIIAFFGCIFFLVVDLQFQQISSVKDRKRAVLLDLGFSGTTLALLMDTVCHGHCWFHGVCRVIAVPAAPCLSPALISQAMAQLMS